MRPDRNLPRGPARLAVLIAVLILGVSAASMWRSWRSERLRREATPAPAGQAEPAPPIAPPSETAPAVTSPEPVVPDELPTPRPGLDRELVGDYRKALEGQGFTIDSLTIVDTRAGGGVRRAEIVYRTRAGSTVEALRPEIIRVISPGANPGLALDQIVVRPTGRDRTPVAVVTITVADLDRWLKAQITDAEFYARWTAGTPTP